MSLYFILNLASISVPFLVSFHPRLKLYKDWNALFLAIFLALIPYIIWDVFFTEWGVWGFNEAYLSGHYLFNLPVEEWLFFICIPYACVFTHYSLLELKYVQISQSSTQNISLSLLGLFFLGTCIFYSNLYTLVDLVFGFFILLYAYFYHEKLLSSFYYTFLFMLIPFFIVNGILTGTGIEDQVVWYNDNENLGIRILTIPVEDSVYAFSLILLNLVLFERFKGICKK